MRRARVWRAWWLGGTAWLALGCSGDSEKRHDDAAVRADGGDSVLEDDASAGRDADVDASGDGGADASAHDAGPAGDATSAEAGSDASSSGADGGDASSAGADGGGVPGPSLFGAAPFSAPSKPVHRLAVVDSSRACVVLSDRTLFCTGTNGQLASEIAAANHDVRSVGFPAVTDVRDYTLLRKDGSSYAFGPTNGLASNYALDGSSYIAAQSWRSAYCGLSSDGSMHCVGDLWPIALPAGPFVNFGGSPAEAQFIGLRVDGSVVLVSAAGTQQVSDLRFTSFDAARAFEGCGEATDGSFHCYQFDGGRVSKHWPQAQRELRDYTYARAHVCVVQSDGKASCQKFDGTDSADMVPQDKRFVDIDTFDTTASCGVTMEGELWCWGETAANTRRVTLPMPAAVE